MSLDEGNVSRGAGALAGWKCIFLANGFTGVPQPSGGTTHFTEVASAWLADGLDLTVQTCASGVENLRLERYEGPVLRAPLDLGNGENLVKVVLMYLARMISVPFVLPWRAPRALLYGTSDLFCDTVPCFLRRVLGRERTCWVNCVWHLLPAPSIREGSRLVNTLAFLAQRFSMILIKSAADLVLVDNPVLRDQLLALGFEPRRVFITAMGVELPPRPPVPAPRYDACYMGRLHPSKGVFELLDAWEKVRRSVGDATLVIVGTGRDDVVRELEERIRSRGLSGAVEMVGYVTRERLDEILCSSRVFVFPSHEEGFGISLLEGMAHGLPAVAFELPHYHDVFGDTVQTVPEGDVDAFASAVVRLLGDDELRWELAERGRQLGERYTWHSVADGEAEAIAGVIGVPEADRRASYG
ncbi:MAG: glycosyltransferase [Actinobacteria bacterium]|nr:glycosyltransferase [Actinomycetota bacterium]MBU1942228.1 glycosyltransferase [Actinomycetota bacterium]MBU2687423.1 glycosyltransferase [Actinomycetota bacterium]